jgi:hypothetical protein
LLESEAQEKAAKLDELQLNRQRVPAENWGSTTSEGMKQVLQQRQQRETAKAKAQKHRERKQRRDQIVLEALHQRDLARTATKLTKSVMAQALKDLGVKTTGSREAQFHRLAEKLDLGFEMSDDEQNPVEEDEEDKEDDAAQGQDVADMASIAAPAAEAGEAADDDGDVQMVSEAQQALSHHNQAATARLIAVLARRTDSMRAWWSRLDGLLKVKYHSQTE